MSGDLVELCRQRVDDITPFDDTFAVLEQVLQPHE